MKKCSEHLQKIAVGTNKLLLTFYDEASKENSEELRNIISTGKYEIYTTVLNIAELYHIIQKKEYELYISKNNLSRKQFSFEQFKSLEYESENFKKKFNSIYNKISSYINIEKYVLNENFEDEYSSQYSSNTIFNFALSKFCEDNDIKNVI